MTRSAAGRRNRVAMPDALKHTAGSISFGQHKNNMESYDTTMTEKYGENSSSHSMVDPEVWLDAAGPNKKGQVHGIGNNLHIGINNTMPASSSSVVGHSRSTSLTQDIIGNINEAVNATVATTIASFVQTQLVPMLSLILSTIGSTNVAPHAPSQGATVREGQEDDEDEANLD